VFVFYFVGNLKNNYLCIVARKLINIVNNVYKIKRYNCIKKYDKIFLTIIMFLVLFFIKNNITSTNFYICAINLYIHIKYEKNSIS